MRSGCSLVISTFVSFVVKKEVSLFCRKYSDKNKRTTFAIDECSLVLPRSNRVHGGHGVFLTSIV